jgi:hypothetical protein
MVESEERGSRIATTPAKPSGNRNGLGQGDFYPLPHMHFVLQEHSCTHDEIAVIRWQGWCVAAEKDSPLIVWAKSEPITEVEHLENGLNGVIAIRTLSHNA